MIRCLCAHQQDLWFGWTVAIGFVGRCRRFMPKNWKQIWMHSMHCCLYLHSLHLLRRYNRSAPWHASNSESIWSSPGTTRQFRNNETKQSSKSYLVQLVQLVRHAYIPTTANLRLAQLPPIDCTNIIIHKYLLFMIGYHNPIPLACTHIVTMFMCTIAVVLGGRDFEMIRVYFCRRDKTSMREPNGIWAQTKSAKKKYEWIIGTLIRIQSVQSFEGEKSALFEIVFIYSSAAKMFSEAYQRPINSCVRAFVRYSHCIFLYFYLRVWIQATTTGFPYRKW